MTKAEEAKAHRKVAATINRAIQEHSGLIPLKAQLAYLGVAEASVVLADALELKPIARAS